MAGGHSPAPLRAGTLPQRIEPMLAVLAPEPFDAPDRLFEVKWDGIRAIAFVSRGQVRFQSRNLKDITAPFSDVAAELLRSLDADGVALDGELVSPDKDGVPRLPRVMQRVHAEGAAALSIPVDYEVFDILYRGYEPVMREPLMRRKALLRETLQPTDRVHICHYEEQSGLAFFEAATKLGLEGIIAKQRQGLYVPGKRSRSWLKIKAFKTANAVVGGYTIGGGSRKELFGSLLLGAYDRKGLRYLGNVGGGFQAEDLDLLLSLLSPLISDTCPFTETPDVGKLLYWCEPRLVVQVKYGEVTESGHLRFPIFKALRPDVDPRECTLAGVREG